MLKVPKRTVHVHVQVSMYYLYRLYRMSSTPATTPTIIKMIITVMKNPRASLLYPSPVEEEEVH